MQEEVERMNARLLDLLSQYLNENPAWIDSKMVENLKENCKMTDKEAVSVLLAIELGINFDVNEEDRYLFENYFEEMIWEMNPEIYRQDPYYANIQIPDKKIGSWELKKESYKPYELFVMNDFKKKKDGRIIPQLGFFKEKFDFPTVLQSKREWMMITPNEIETMKEAIYDAEGAVLTSGLGLGYFAYMCSEKENVQSVTIIEQDQEIIDLFESTILEQFPHREKIRIIQDDALSYIRNADFMKGIDFVFWDLWHDVQDGLPLYRHLKRMEKQFPEIRFAYWIEKTMSCYIEE